ncbi:hypothetical protein NMY22_g10022 [Coprinellus aureogranulatus]|nr:hypothetical protein NMY22_g10022 [Coprinellus aureogranulatus]
MTQQLLPNDILLLVLEDHLTPSAGYSSSQRLQAIKNFSLSSRTLAIACRKLIFKRTNVVVGQPSTPKGESVAEGLQELFEATPSYCGFVNSLRIEACLVVSLVDATFANDVTITSAEVDDRSQHPHISDSSPTVTSIRYTSTPREEAAVCWLLSQHFPNLKAFHFVVRPHSGGDQITLPKAAFGGTSPLPTLMVETKLPKAIIRFLSAGSQRFQHLTLSSNLPPRILRYYNGARPLKSLSLTTVSEAKPTRRNGGEVPVFLGVDDAAGSFPIPCSGRIEVEELHCDMQGGSVLQWLHGPDCSVDLGRLKTLRLSPAKAGRPFPFIHSGDSLTTLEILYSHHLTTPVSLAAPTALRQLTIRVDSKWTLDQVAFSLNTVQSRSIERLEVALRLTHVMDFKIIQLLTSLDRRLFSGVPDWQNLKTLRIVGYLAEEEWDKVEAKNGFWGFTSCLRSLFNPLLKGSATSSATSKGILDVAIVKESDYLRGRW